MRGVLVLFALSACHDDRTIAVHAVVCDALCGGAPAESAFDCAVAARLRIYDAAKQATATWPPPYVTETPIAETCIDLTAAGSVDALLGGDGLATGLSNLSLSARTVIAELALYAPNGTLTCPADGPLVALGRSPPTDLHAGTSIGVTLGCHPICATQSGVTLELHTLEDDQPVTITPDLHLDEISSYASLVSTGGVCEASTSMAPLGEARAWNVAQQLTTLTGRFGLDSSATAGCTAAEVGTAGDSTYACLGRKSGTTATAWTLRDEHLVGLRALNPASATHGLLVLRILASGAPVSGVTARFGTVSASYVVDEAWSQVGGTATSALGIAVFPDAPTGAFELTFPDASTQTVQAGGADDPGSVTTLLVEH